MEDFDFTEVEKYLSVSLFRYQSMFPELWEDALQEGMIQAWRDVEAGVDGGETTKLKILRRASQAGQRYLQRAGEYPFGKPKNSRDGIRQNSVSVNKVSTYLQEFVPVHGRVPSGNEVAQALGISKASARMALKHIREGRIDHMKYHENNDGSRRKDFTYYSTVSVQTLESDSQGRNTTWEDNPLIPSLGIDFETDSVSYLDLIETLNQIVTKHREVLYLYLFEGYNTGDIGRYYQTTSQGGARKVQSALSQVRMVLGIYQGVCAEGKERNSTNTRIRQTPNGLYYYYCDTCRTRPPSDKKGPYKSQIGDPCGKGHFQDKINSKGYARCSKCLAANQALYRARKNASTD